MHGQLNAASDEVSEGRLGNRQRQNDENAASRVRSQPSLKPQWAQCLLIKINERPRFRQTKGSGGKKYTINTRRKNN